MKSWGEAKGTWDFSKQATTYGLLLSKKSFVITEIDVDEGTLFFFNGKRKYNVVVLGFEKYVAQNEHNAYKHFVMEGGMLVELSAENFMVEVASLHPIQVS